MTGRILRRALALLAVTLISLSSAVPASADKGEKTLGVAGGFASYNNGGYGKLYFQYDVIKYIRIAPEIGYVFKNNGKSAFEFSADVQVPFKIAKGFDIYPMLGFTLNSWNFDGHDTATRAGMDFGGGFDVYLTSNLKLTLQAKYSAMNDTGGAFVDMGIGYVF